MFRSTLVRDCLLLWLILLVAGLVCRPLTPVDETRAVSVAFEMWQGGDFLVPHLNGETYSHKPPLLQWLIHLGWLVFGVNEWSARLAAPLVALANLGLTALLARRLWPEQPAVARFAPLLLLGFPVWALWTTLTLYDMLVAFFALLGWVGVVRAAAGENLKGWGVAALAIGGGVLSKGPVILLLILPAALSAPWWLRQPPLHGWGRWYLGMLGAVVVGALLALVWALPAGFTGGEAYRKAIFWGQSAGRIAHSFAHRRPWWWYLAIWPLLVFPWAYQSAFWRDRAGWALDRGLRFCLAQLGAVTLLFSLVSGKQVHYILPILPLAALALAKLAAESSERRLRFDRLWLGSLLLLLGLGLAILAGLELGPRILADASLLAGAVIAAIGLAVLAWRAESREASLRVGVFALVGTLAAGHVLYRETIRPGADLQPVAARLAELQGKGARIAHWGKYSGEYQFLGRLHQPLQVLETREEWDEWRYAHPDGYLLALYRDSVTDAESKADFTHAYRGSRRVGLWKASVLRDETALVNWLLE